MDEGDFDQETKPLHNPYLYWVFGAFIRTALLPIVLPHRFYEEVMEMEVWERTTFLAMITFIFGCFVLIFKLL